MYAIACGIVVIALPSVMIGLTTPSSRIYKLVAQIYN